MLWFAGLLFAASLFATVFSPEASLAFGVNFLEALCLCFFLRFVFFMLITAVYERHTMITEPLLPAREPRLARGEHQRWTIRLTDRAVGELLDAGILSADLKQVKAEY